MDNCTSGMNSCSSSLSMIGEGVSIIPEHIDFDDVHEQVSFVNEDQLQMFVSSNENDKKKEQNTKLTNSNYYFYDSSTCTFVPAELTIKYTSEPAKLVIPDEVNTQTTTISDFSKPNKLKSPVLIKSKASKKLASKLTNVAPQDRREKRSENTHVLVKTKQKESISRVETSDIADETRIDVHLIDCVESQEQNKCSNGLTINQSWFTARKEKLLMKQNGHAWKQGMWSKEETDQLVYNVNEYCKQCGIDDPNTIIFGMSKEERSGFYRVIAKGINRPLFSVYRRVIRMYDNRNHRGKYTPEEVTQLKNLRAKHGSNWQMIASALNRSSASVKDRCRLLNDNCNKGGWTPEEEERLAEAVYHFAKAIPGEQVTNGISWGKVASRVGSRSEKQCRTKWLNYLNWKHTSGVVWSKTDDIQLICRLSVCGMKEEANVDWITLGKGWAACRSPHWLRGKWWDLKRKLPNETQILPLRQLCQVLYNSQNSSLIQSTLVDLPFTTAPMTDKQKLNNKTGSNIKFCVPAESFESIINATKDSEDQLNSLLMDLIRSAIVVTKPDQTTTAVHKAVDNNECNKSLTNKAKITVSPQAIVNTSQVDHLGVTQRSLDESLADDLTLHLPHIESNITSRSHISSRLLQGSIKEEDLSDCDTSTSSLNPGLDSSSSQVILNDAILSVSNELLGREEVLQ